VLLLRVPAAASLSFEATAMLTSLRGPAQAGLVGLTLSRQFVINGGTGTTSQYAVADGLVICAGCGQGLVSWHGIELPKAPKKKTLGGGCTSSGVTQRDYAAPAQNLQI